MNDIKIIIAITSSEQIIKQLYSCLYLTTTALVVSLIVAFFKARKTHSTYVEYSNTEINQDLLKLDVSQVVAPIVPRIFSFLGFVVLIFMFNVTMIFCMNSGVGYIPSVIISLCLSCAFEVITSLILYVYKLKSDTNSIFAPKCVGLVGVVSQEIKTRQDLRGKIRLEVNGKVLEVPAFSETEKLIPVGEKIKVAKAENDRVLIVDKL